MATEHSFNYRGFNFDFKYNYTSGSPATWEHPEEGEEYEIYAITLNDIDAEDLIHPMYDDFVDEAIKNIKSYYE